MLASISLMPLQIQFFVDLEFFVNEIVNDFLWRLPFSFQGVFDFRIDTDTRLRVFFHLAWLHFFRPFFLMYSRILSSITQT